MSGKTGTITFHWATNYGGVLQAWALQQALLKLGEDTEIIDFVPERVRFLIVLKDLIDRSFGEFKKERSIARFRKEHLILSRRYGNTRALKKAGHDYKRIITGSDQVWNYSLITSYGKKPMLSYFLDFAEEGVKRYSYATSFGANKMPADYAGMVRGELEKFKAISVREDTGRDIVSDIGFDSRVVCDPTALLTAEDYNKLIPEKKAAEPYIYSYVIHKGQHTAKAVEAAVRELYPAMRFRSTSNNEGVEEWLRSIRDASLFVTNSFHGVMVSLILGTPFIVVPVEGWDMNARIENVLSSTGSLERLVLSADLETVRRAAEAQADRKSVLASLEKMRNEGLAFLRECLRED